MDLLLPASLPAQGSVKGKNDISLAQPLEAVFRARNSPEGLSFAFPSNFDSHNRQSPHWNCTTWDGSFFFSDIYPGSISDNSITEKSEVVHWIQPEHELMADRGFAIQDLCALKGIYLNRPAQKLSDQFTQAEVACNFDISSARIHVERFIGRVREWSILNAVWPVQRMDLLSSTWQALCHIVNMTMPSIGPRENK